jgi:hypothetical protein
MKRSGEFRNCLICGKQFYAHLYRIKSGLGRFCCVKCSDKAKLGKPSWNKGKKMPYRPRLNLRGKIPKSAFKKGMIPWNKGKILIENRDENNGNWKGDKAKTDAIHKWVIERLGKPSKCDICHTTEKKKISLVKYKSYV